MHSLQTDSLRTDFKSEKGFGFSRIMRGADSHMRCLLFKKTLSNQHIFIRIEMLFNSDFNTVTLCKYEAYFALNLFCGIITLCKNAWHKSLTVPTGASEISPPYFSLSALLFSRCLDVSHRVNRRRRRHIVFVVTVVTL